MASWRHLGNFWRHLEPNQKKVNGSRQAGSGGGVGSGEYEGNPQVSVVSLFEV